MDRNNNAFSQQSSLYNSLCALIQVVQCADNSSCICQHPTNCLELKTLLHHIRTCDRSQECGFSRCIQTILLMRHYLNCDQPTCVCFQLGERRSENRFYRVIKDILLKNQFLIWRRKMTPFRQDFLRKITNYLIGFCEDNKETISGHILKFLMNFENEQFSRSGGISTYLTTIAQKCSEIQTKIMIQNQQKHNTNFVIDQEANMKKIYQMLCLYSTDILHDRMANKILVEERCVEKMELHDESQEGPYIKSESQNHNLIKQETKENDPIKTVPSTESSSSNALTPPKSNTSMKSSPEPCCQPTTEFVKSWSKIELEEMFRGILQRIWNDKDGEPFLYPVDWKALCIEDYPLIVTQPMDLSTIRRKLSGGDYNQPWQVIDDFWLMFNNAWLYNKKSSKVYKSCTGAARLFEGLADEVMMEAGLCCGRDYVYLPQVLICCTPRMCTIARDSVYYCINNDEDEAHGGKTVADLGSDKYVCCDKCFAEGRDDVVEIMKSESTATVVPVDKKLFTKLKNNIKEREEFVECRRCRRQWHRVCAGHVDEIWRSGFFCRGCEPYRQHSKQQNRLTASQLPHCALSRHIESQLDAWRLKQRDVVPKVIVRVLSVSEKTVEVRPEMKKAFVDSGEIADSLPYRLKAVFAFQEQDESAMIGRGSGGGSASEVCLFGMQCQEYGSECPDPNSRRVYLAYLDSVHFFRPRSLRTDFYHRLLIAYLDYCRQMGFVFAHIWACPPGDGDDYIFHMHPPAQRLPKPKRLQEWYIAMLDQAVKEESIVDYCDIFSYTFSSRLLSISELPYFEGDYWPTVLEDFLKEDSHGIEHFMSLMDEDSVQEQTEVVEHPNSKKRKLKKLPNYSKRKRNAEMFDGSSDLTKRLFELIEKRKENFIVVRLHNQVDASKLPPIVDPDPLGFSELMDGRDRFLSLSREKHLEFSSLRRASFATLVLCYELHLELRQGVIYTCNHCDMLLDDVRYTCSICDEYELCEPCAGAQRHEHKLQRLSSEGGGSKGGIDSVGTSSANGDSGCIASTTSTSTTATSVTVMAPEQQRLEQTKQLMHLFEHAYSCRDANCRKVNCKKLKFMIEHPALCNIGASGNCKICDNVMKMHLQHTKLCVNHNCPLQLCVNKRRSTKTVGASHHQSRLMQLAMERRRINSAVVAAAPSMATSTTITAKALSVVPVQSTVTGGGSMINNDPYKTEMTVISSYIGQLKTEPGMTQERLRASFQDFLDRNPRYKEAYLDNIHRQKQRQLQQSSTMNQPRPVTLAATSGYTYGQTQPHYGQYFTTINHSVQQQQQQPPPPAVASSHSNYLHSVQQLQQQPAAAPAPLSHTQMLIVQSQPGPPSQLPQQPQQQQQQHIFYQAHPFHSNNTQSNNFKPS